VSIDLRSTQELLPWLIPLNDGIVACKDSSLLAAFEFFGPDRDSVTEGEMAQVGQAVERMLMSLSGQPVTVWWTVRRELTTDYPGRPMPDVISQMLDDEHRRVVMSNAAYINRHFLSVLWMPEKNAGTMFEKFGALVADGVNVFSSMKTAAESTFLGREAFAWKIAELEQVLTEFEERLYQMESMLDGLRPRRLMGEHLIGFLWAMCNPGASQCPKQWDGAARTGTPFLDASLSESPVIVHRDALQFGDVDPVYVKAFSMKSWPSLLAFGAFNGLLSLPTELVISHCFRVMPPNLAEKHVKSIKTTNEMMQYPVTARITSAMMGKPLNPKAANPARRAAAEEAREALGELTAGRFIFGWHNLTFVFMNRDAKRLEESVRECLRLMNSSPFVGTVRETVGLLSAWCTTLPGCWREGKRWLTISSVNMTDIAPLLGVHQGARWNEHLGKMLGKPCPALTVLGTDYNTPFWFNFHVDALGHAMVVGPSRAGKSIGMNFLISQFRKYGDAANIIILDKDYSCRIPTLLQGGEHIDLRDGAAIRLNPMQLAKDTGNWSFLATWLEGLLSSRGDRVDDQGAKLIYKALEVIKVNPSPEMWRLRTVRTQIDKELGKRLDAWIEKGQYGNIFDNTEDAFNLSSFTCIEMGEVMKDPRLARPLMEYIFYRIQKQLEAQRTGEIKATMIYIEECWFLLENEYFATRLKDWLKTFAKLNAFLVLTTQSIEDLESVPSTVFSSIRDNIQTRIFIPNANAKTEKLQEFYRRNFDLRPELIDRIAKGTPRRDYLIVQPDVARQVRLQLTPRQVSALRSDIAAQKIFEHAWMGKSPGWESRYIETLEKTS